MDIKEQRKVLIVDDDESLRDALYMDLKMQGFKAYTAASGGEALELLKTITVDVVLSDIQMPGGNGMQLLEEIRKGNPKMPVVVLMTGYSHVAPAEAIDKGAFQVLIKPFGRDLLFKSLSEAIKTR